MFAYEPSGCPPRLNCEPAGLPSILDSHSLRVDLHSVSGKRFSLDQHLVTLSDNSPRLADYTEEKKFQDEWELLGLSVRKRPIVYLMNGYSRNRFVRSSELRQHVGKVVRLAGILAAVRDTETSKGELMRFLTLEDEDGIFEVTLFPSAYRYLYRRVAGIGPYFITGKVEDQYGSLTIMAKFPRYWGTKNTNN